MNKRILLIEDNPISREFLYEALIPLGMPVDIAETLAAAKILAQQHQHCLFLCDVHLPDGEASEILQTLKQQQSSTLAVAITAEAGPDAQQALLAMGYQEVWPKPISMAALQANVARLLSIAKAASIKEPRIELWDESAALRAVGNNQATLTALRTMFLAELPQQTKIIETAYAIKNFAGLKAECHKLLAGCGFVGAAGLSHAVRQLSENPDDHEKKMTVLQQAEKYLLNN